MSCDLCAQNFSPLICHISYREVSHFKKKGDGGEIDVTILENLTQWQYSKSARYREWSKKSS